jgi:hypothetical protein
MNAIVEEMLKEMNFWTSASEEVFKFHATALIEDFNVPATFVVDMMHSLKAAVGGEYGD